jgi:hypothetical protein
MCGDGEDTSAWMAMDPCGVSWVGFYSRDANRGEVREGQTALPFAMGHYSRSPEALLRPSHECNIWDTTVEEGGTQGTPAAHSPGI